MSGAVPFVLLRHEALSELRSTFPAAAVYCLDAGYNVVTREAVETYSHELHRELFGAGIMEWDEAFDCEDFSVFGWSLAKRKHLAAKRKRGSAIASGVAIGILCYAINGEMQRGHAIMIFRTIVGWEGYEPQTRQFVKLSQIEKERSWLVLV